MFQNALRCRDHLTSQLADVANSVYDSKRKEFLGRDGARWAKLGIFYFFFYLGLGFFFCGMIALFMHITPRDRPRYFGKSSTMNVGSQTLSPGLGFRPSGDPESHLIFVNKSSNGNVSNLNVARLEQYLRFYYPKFDQSDSYLEESRVKPFIITNPEECSEETQYGYNVGRPCVLIKMNKIVDFEPEPGYRTEEKETFEKAGCEENLNATAIHCYGEYPADVDNIGTIVYISENGHSDRCGSLETKWFPYRGKYQHRDVYQAPYIWVQFLNPKAHVLIDVVCRLFARNIHFNKIRAQASTRFQIYVNETSTGRVPGEETNS